MSKTITMSEKQLNALIASAVKSALASVNAPVKGKAKATSSSKKPAKAKGNKAPTTRTQAVQAWKDKHNITADTTAEYKRVYEANFAKDWAKWTASKAYKALAGAERKSANQAKAKELRNKYRKQVGITKLEK